MDTVWESEMHLVAKKLKGLEDIVPAKGKYSYYDASSKKYVIEYKARRKYYDTTQIELDKYNRLLEEGDDSYRQVLYVVFDGEKHMHFFNLTDLDEEGYDYKWTVKKCPATTDFNRREMIDKDVGEICWSKAMHKVKIR